MIKTDTLFMDMINSPVRKLKARVELYNGSTLLNTFKHTDRLISFTVERVGDESKFFGFGFCQRLNVKLLDSKRELNITTANTIEIVFGVGSDYVYALPLFKVSEVHRNENTNELSITAYDALYGTDKRQINEFIKPGIAYTMEEYAAECAAAIGLPLKIEGGDLSPYYPQGANLEGTETIRELLNAIAEATQTIYFINSEWELVFKRLDASGSPVIVIDREKYFSLDSGTNRRLVGITHTTQLGDNYEAKGKDNGTIQYIRDNPLWEMRDDTAELVEVALYNMYGFTINQFTCEWRGNYLVEIGDRIGLITKNNELVYSYLLNDTIIYDGTYTQKSSWNYTNEETETAANPTNIGDAMRQTYAKVDKINKDIAIVASDITDVKNDIASIQLNTNSITASVSKMEQNNNSAFDNLNNEISTLNSKVAATMTADDVKIEIQKEVSNGAKKVITSTGYTFDDAGLTIDRDDSALKTFLNVDGMRIFKNNEAVLTANNEGVNATNLHATTYLIIGGNSRFEDYNGNRTGCFWIG